MKNLQLFLIGLFSIIFVQQGNTQWTELGSGVTASNHRIWGLSIIDENQVWGISSAFPLVDDHLVKTTDGGTSWSAIPFAIDDGLYSIQIFPVDSLNAWLATADELNPISGKIYKTSDGGINWIEQGTAFTGFNETPAIVHFWDFEEGVAFGSTCNINYNDQITIYRTSDGGNNWTKITGDSIPGQLAGEGMCVSSGNNFYDVIGDTIWFVTSMNRLFKSINRGLTWEAHDVVLSGTGRVSSFSFKDHLNGIAVAIFPNEVVRTTDGGNNWTTMMTPVGTTTAEIDYLDGSIGSYIIHDAILNSNGSIKMFITHDDGETWDVFISNVELDCFQFLSENIGFGGGEVINENSGGIYKWEGVSANLIVDTGEDIKLFPNPVSSYLHLQFPQNISPELIIIKDYSGKTYFSQEIQYGNSIHSINTEILPAGMYFLEMVMKNSMVAKKFTKI